ncbi:hypothetical protein J7I98_40155 [Streptomyces sp. ISL-98]|uniref:hypothetical protein n=1 Tax=Streptomyces sp. ISL-98 TaxID=2819192 RepID=UPI001BE7E6F8|nr:hypothetical protein [Streptomyces sp. ISL-98]MBT2511862.1 hypothetical protein [Streptomyces sp. ISL-98]
MPADDDITPFATAHAQPHSPAHQRSSSRASRLRARRAMRGKLINPAAALL